MSNNAVNLSYVFQPAKTNTTVEMPYDVLGYISVKYLSTTDVGSVASTCRGLHGIFNHVPVKGKSILRRTMEANEMPRFESGYIDYCKQLLSQKKVEGAGVLEQAMKLWKQYEKNVNKKLGLKELDKAKANSLLIDLGLELKRLFESKEVKLENNELKLVVGGILVELLVTLKTRAYIDARNRVRDFSENEQYSRKWRTAAAHLFTNLGSAAGDNKEIKKAVEVFFAEVILGETGVNLELAK